VQQARVLPHRIGDVQDVTLEQALVAVLVGDDLDIRGDLAVSLDEATHGRREARGEAAGGEQGDATYGHAASTPRSDE
jgi:hypothetical protein